MKHYLEVFKTTFLSLNKSTLSVYFVFDLGEGTILLVRIICFLTEKSLEVKVKTISTYQMIVQGHCGPVKISEFSPQGHAPYTDSTGHALQNPLGANSAAGESHHQYSDTVQDQHPASGVTKILLHQYLANLVLQTQAEMINTTWIVG